MTNLTRLQRSAILIALSLATVLVACKTIDPIDPKMPPIEDPRVKVKYPDGRPPDKIPSPENAEIAGADFLRSNKDKQGVVTLPSGLQYRIVDEGNGNIPELEDSVLVHYKTINLRGQVVDDSREYDGGKPQSFKVAKVIGGWREALMRMPEGSRWKLYVPSDLGYGSTGIAGVGPNETLVYDIELFKVKSIGSRVSPDPIDTGDLAIKGLEPPD